MKWDEMRWDDQLLSSIRPPGWHSHWMEDEAVDSEKVEICRLAGLERNAEWQTKRKRILLLLLLYKRSGRGVQEEVCAFFCSGWRGRRYCCCCCIKWIKRKKILPLLLLYKISGRGVQEEVLAFFYSGRRGRGGGGLGTSRLQLDGWGRRHGRKLSTANKHTHSNLKLKLKKIYTIQSWCP